MEKSIHINAEKCTRCGLCAADCVVGCLVQDADGIPFWPADGKERCVGCQHCMAVCPSGAFSFGGADPAALPRPFFVNDRDMLAMIRSRRSVRRYLPQNVSPAILDKIRDMLSYPPSGGNRDNLHFTIIGSMEKMDAIRKATCEAVARLQPDSPIYSIKAMLEKYAAAGGDIIYRGAPAMIVCAIDLSRTIGGCETADPIIALSYFELFAQSLGLGTVWDDMAVMIAQHCPDVHALLEIPEGYSIGYILPFGLPAVRYARMPLKEKYSVKILA